MFRKLKLNKNVMLGGALFASAPDLSDIENYKRRTGFYVEDRWTRVKMIFRKHKDGSYHPDMSEVFNMLKRGAILGGVCGGFYKSVSNIQNYEMSVQSTMFLNIRHAYRTYGRHCMFNFGRGVVKYAPFGALFLGGLTLFKVCCQAYRNKYGILEYTFGASVIGSLFRFNYGPRGMVAGAVVGGVLGTLYGLFIYCIVKIMGLDMYDFKYMQYCEILNKTRKMSYDIIMYDTEEGPSSSESNKFSD